MGNVCDAPSAGVDEDVCYKLWKEPVSMNREIDLRCLVDALSAIQPVAALFFSSYCIDWGRLRTYLEYPIGWYKEP